MVLSLLWPTYYSLYPTMRWGCIQEKVLTTYLIPPTWGQLSRLLSQTYNTPSFSWVLLRFLACCTPKGCFFSSTLTSAHLTSHYLSKYDTPGSSSILLQVTLHSWRTPALSCWAFVLLCRSLGSLPFFPLRHILLDTPHTISSSSLLLLIFLPLQRRPHSMEHLGWICSWVGPSWPIALSPHSTPFPGPLLSLQCSEVLCRHYTSCIHHYIASLSLLQPLFLGDHNS